MSTQPRVVVFDVIETLFSLEPTRAAMTEVGLPPDALEVWFARLLRDAFAITAAGGYAGFEVVAKGALTTVLGEGQDRGDHIAEILGSLSALPAHQDAEPALSACARAGVPVVALTNGTAEGTDHLLDRSGLAPLVSRVLSVHDVGMWKPHPSVYQAAIGEVEPQEAALLAVHGWDIYGARHAGLMTGWCSRLDGILPPSLGPADVEGDDLVTVVERLLER
ncbi:MAG: haloacid dehalogenase [Acidothermales bacterium]|nr:haloacid dehalogenase [Acidothermales bacterium]